jgi:hypothetical protein
MNPALRGGRWGHIGLYGPSHVETLLYSPTAASLVAVTSRRLEEGFEVRRLYYRPVSWGLYMPVGVRHPMETQNDAVCCCDAPYLFFNVWRYQAIDPRWWYPSEILGSRLAPSPGFGADWFGVDRFDLRTGEHQTVLDERTMLLPPGYVGGWISRIMSVSADGASAICHAGLDLGGQVRYFVCEVELFDGSTTIIAELPDVWG